MLPSRLMIAGLIAVAGCAAPAYPPPVYPAWAAYQPIPLGGFNTEPWVGTQTPSGPYTTSGTHQAFQTPNSLPQGAWTTPVW